MDQNPQPFWSIITTERLDSLLATTSGLTTGEVKKRLISYGANRLKPQKRSDALTLLFSQFKSPIILILLFATGLSFFLHNPVDALIILAIVIISGLLGFWQENSASNAIDKLLATVQIKASVLPDKDQQKISTGTNTIHSDAKNQDQSTYKRPN